MKPVYTAAAARLKTELPASKMAAIDVAKYKELAKTYDVKTIPTLIYFE